MQKSEKLIQNTGVSSYQNQFISVISNHELSKEQQKTRDEMKRVDLDRIEFQGPSVFRRARRLKRDTGKL